MKIEQNFTPQAPPQEKNREDGKKNNKIESEMNGEKTFLNVVRRF